MNDLSPQKSSVNVKQSRSPSAIDSDSPTTTSRLQSLQQISHQHDHHNSQEGVDDLTASKRLRKLRPTEFPCLCGQRFVSSDEFMRHAPRCPDFAKTAVSFAEAAATASGRPVDDTSPPSCRSSSESTSSIGNGSNALDLTTRPVTNGVGSDRLLSQWNISKRPDDNFTHQRTYHRQPMHYETSTPSHRMDPLVPVTSMSSRQLQPSSVQLNRNRPPSYSHAKGPSSGQIGSPSLIPNNCLPHPMTAGQYFNNQDNLPSKSTNKLTMNRPGKVANRTLSHPSSDGSSDNHQRQHHLHQLADTQARPFKCCHCIKSFKSKALLDQHMHIHYPPKYTCRYCAKKYRWPPVFYHHQRTCKKRPPPTSSTTNGSASNTSTTSSILASATMSSNRMDEGYVRVKPSSSMDRGFRLADIANTSPRQFGMGDSIPFSGYHVTNRPGRPVNKLPGQIHTLSNSIGLSPSIGHAVRQHNAMQKQSSVSDFGQSQMISSMSSSRSTDSNTTYRFDPSEHNSSADRHYLNRIARHASIGKPHPDNGNNLAINLSATISQCNTFPFNHQSHPTHQQLPPPPLGFPNLTGNYSHLPFNPFLTSSQQHANPTINGHHDNSPSHPTVPSSTFSIDRNENNSRREFSCQSNNNSSDTDTVHSPMTASEPMTCLCGTKCSNFTFYLAHLTQCNLLRQLFSPLRAATQPDSVSEMLLSHNQSHESNTKPFSLDWLIQSQFAPYRQELTNPFSLLSSALANTLNPNATDQKNQQPEQSSPNHYNTKVESSLPEQFDLSMLDRCLINNESHRSNNDMFGNEIGSLTTKNNNCIGKDKIDEASRSSSRASTSSTPHKLSSSEMNCHLNDSSSEAIGYDIHLDCPQSANNASVNIDHETDRSSYYPLPTESPVPVNISSPNSSDNIEIDLTSSRSNRAVKQACQQCGKEFGSRLSLKQHVEGKHGTERKYQCSGCAKRYRWGASYYYHRKSCHAVPTGIGSNDEPPQYFPSKKTNGQGGKASSESASPEQRRDQMAPFDQSGSISTSDIDDLDQSHRFANLPLSIEQSQVDQRID